MVCAARLRGRRPRRGGSRGPRGRQRPPCSRSDQGCSVGVLSSNVTGGDGGFGGDDGGSSSGSSSSDATTCQPGDVRTFTHAALHARERAVGETGAPPNRWPTRSATASTRPPRPPRRAPRTRIRTRAPVALRGLPHSRPRRRWASAHFIDHAGRTSPRTRAAASRLTDPGPGGLHVRQGGAGARGLRAGRVRRVLPCLRQREPRGARRLHWRRPPPAGARCSPSRRAAPPRWWRPGERRSARASRRKTSSSRSRPCSARARPRQTHRLRRATAPGGRTTPATAATRGADAATSDALVPDGGSDATAPGDAHADAPAD